MNGMKLLLKDVCILKRYANRVKRELDLFLKRRKEKCTEFNAKL
jgi:hypothetical protein